MDQEKRVHLERVIHNGYKNMAGLVVLKDGKIVYEKYDNGCTVGDTLHVCSVTKSVTSMLIGIAIQEGAIKSIDQKVLTFFPDYIVEQGEKTIQQITIRHLLTMTAPYKCKAEPYAKVMTSQHWMEPALDLLGGKGPIGAFRYSPMVGTHLLSGIFTKATGKSLLAFANEKVFHTLGITNLHDVPLRSEQESRDFLHGKNQNGWVVDPEGYHTAAWGLTLTARDMAKIGQLYLQKGSWENRQIVPEEWVIESTKEQSHWGKLGYGYLWWIIDKEGPSFAAMGDGGNIIYVNVKKNIVVASNALFVQNAKDRLKLITDYIVPMVEEV